MNSRPRHRQPGTFDYATLCFILLCAISGAATGVFFYIKDGDMAVLTLGLAMSLFTSLCACNVALTIWQNKQASKQGEIPHSEK